MLAAHNLDTIIDGGTYVCTEDDDHTKLFKNGLKLTFQGPIAVLTVKPRRKQEKQELNGRR